MAYDIRRVDTADERFAVAVRELRTESFGLQPEGEQPSRTPVVTWGAFDTIGHLVAVADDCAFGSYFGGVSVSTAGIGGVAVAPEHRGRGLASALMRAVVVGARERGAVVSSLFGAAPELYRRLGYGMLANAYQWRIPMSKLGGVRAPAGYDLVRGEEADLPEIAELYTRMAVIGTGMADRAGIGPETKSVIQYTLARGAEGRLAGYCSWRTSLSDRGMELHLGELRAEGEPATRALIASLARWSSMVENITVTAVDSEPFWNTVPGVIAPSGIAPYMLRILDPARAVEARRWNGAVSGVLLFELRDPTLVDNSGTWQLSVGGGAAMLVSATLPASLVLTAEGLALWFSGVATCAELRRLGLLEGGDANAEALLDSMAVQSDPSVTYYF